jgi:hypothetical protein
VSQVLKPSDEGYAYYASAFANVRVKSTFDSIVDPTQYEYFTPCDAILQGDCNVSMGAAAWAWKRADLGRLPSPVTMPTWRKFGPDEERQAIEGGWLQPSDARMQVVDGATGKPIQPSQVL